MKLRLKCTKTHVDESFIIAVHNNQTMEELYLGLAQEEIRCKLEVGSYDIKVKRPEYVPSLIRIDIVAGDMEVRLSEPVVDSVYGKSATGKLRTYMERALWRLKQIGVLEERNATNKES